MNKRTGRVELTVECWDKHGDDILDDSGEVVSHDFKANQFQRAMDTAKDLARLYVVALSVCDTDGTYKTIVEWGQIDCPSCGYEHHTH